MQTLRETHRLDGQPGTDLLACAWRQDGLLLASGDTAGTVRLWEPSASPPRQRAVRVGMKNASISHTVAFSPEGRHLAVTSADGLIYLLRLANPGEVYRLPSP